MQPKLLYKYLPFFYETDGKKTLVFFPKVQYFQGKDPTADSNGAVYVNVCFQEYLNCTATPVDSGLTEQMLHSMTSLKEFYKFY